MGKDHRGHPSGVNKSEGTGVPSNFENKDLDKDQELTEQYTDEQDNLSDSVRQNHPNRNRNKEEATNTGGYKS